MMAIVRFLLGKPAWLVEATLAVAKAIEAGQSERAKRLAFEAALNRQLDIVAERAAKLRPK